MKKLSTIRTLCFAIFCLGLSIAGATPPPVGDAGISAITEPTSPVCKGSSPVVAVISNFGTSFAISTVTVNWKVNGVSQTPYNYTGNIAIGSTDTVVLGTYNFSSGSDTIESWTSDPNIGTDSDNSNDSLTEIIAVSSKLTGTYTIAGTTPDFANFNAAVSALTSNGICGPVVFNMRAYTDSMQAVIPQIVGADSVNTITFQSENGDSTSVILTYPSVDTINNFNYLIRLNGADYLTFNALTLRRSGILTNGRVLVFDSNATHNTVTHCRIISAPSNTPNSLAALIHSESGGGPSAAFNDSMNTFTYNYLKNGSLGIYMNGISGLSLEYYTTITNNIFENQYFKGIQMMNQGFATIRENTFTTDSTYRGYSAIYLDRSLRPHKITKNQILNTPGTGIFLVDCIAQAGVHGTIANNFIHSNDSAGISIVNGDYQDIIFNSILMTGTDSSFSALAVRGVGTGKVIMNNILSNRGDGYAYLISDGAQAGIQRSDYNDIHSTGQYVGLFNGVEKDSLSWVAAIQKDTNSIYLNPNFATVTDFHVTSIAMDDRGKPFGGVTDDLEGDTRSNLTPDIGADEYSSSARNIGIIGIISPVDSTCGSPTTTVSVIVTNTGGTAETNFDVVTKISGALTQTLTQVFTASLAPGTSDTLTYSTTINTNTTGTYNFKSYTSPTLFNDDVHANDTLQLAIVQFTQPGAPTATGTSICGSGTDTLTAVSSDTLHWYAAMTGGSLLDTGAAFLPPNAVTTTTYYVAGKSGCEGPRTAVVLTVRSLPVVSLGNDTSILQGQTDTLNAGTFVAYLWSTGATTQKIGVDTTTSGCYNVRVTDAFGCNGRDTACVTVIAPSDAGVTSILSPTDKLCADDSINVTVRVTNLGSTAANTIPVSAQINGAVSANFSDTIFSLAPGADTTLTLGMIDGSAGGVVAIKIFTSYTNDQNHVNDTLMVSDTIVIEPALPLGINGSRCGAGTSLVIATASDSIRWYDAPTGGNLLFVGDNYLINSLGTTTTYYAQNGNVCSVQDRTPVIATINNASVFLGNDTIASDSLILDAGPGFVSYLWNNNSTGQTLTVKADSTYSVCVIDNNGCSACDSIDVTITVGITPIQADANVRLYPNPAHTNVIVEMKKSIKGKTSFTISNMQGQLILNEENENVSSKSFNVAGYSKGIYFLKITSENSSSVYRLVIE